MSVVEGGSHETDVVEPLRLSYADGGTYLSAFVPEYNETRNSAIERILTLRTLNETFSPRPLPAEPFAHSLGAQSGRNRMHTSA